MYSDCGDCNYPVFSIFCIQSKNKTDLATMTEGYEEKLSKAEEELAAVQVQTALSCTVHTYMHTYVCLGLVTPDVLVYQGLCTYVRTYV